MLIAGLFLSAQQALAIGIQSPLEFTFSNGQNTLEVKTIATGNNSQGWPCPYDWLQSKVTEYQLSTTASWSISGTNLSGSTNPALQAVGQNGCTSYNDYTPWSYNLDIANIDVSSLAPSQYNFCITVYGYGSPSNFTQCSPFTIGQANEGTVIVQSNVSTTWNLYGPSNSGGTGTYEVYSSMPTGTYSVSPASIGGYSYSVSPSSGTLSNNGSLTFNITYTGNAPGGFSITSASASCTANNTAVSLNWSSSSNASSYNVYVRFWSSGSWNLLVSGLTGTSYSYSERKGVDLYYYVQANGNGSTNSNVVYAGQCPLPAVTISANPTSVAYNGTTTVYWTPSNAYLCTASGGSSGWAGSQSSSSGTHNWTSGPLTSNTTYTIVCSDADGGYPSSPQSVSVAITSPTATIAANPTTLSWSNSGSTITWSSTSASSCSVTVNGSPAWTGTSGSQNTGSLSPGTYTYTNSCSGNGTAQASTTVTVTAPTPSVSNVTENTPDYCLAGPSGTTVSWAYSDQANSPETAYEVQVTDTGSFNNPMYDSGKINSSSTTTSLQSAGLQFNTTYKARVEVWDGYDQPSGWSNPTGSWKTPLYAYPQVSFTWSPTSPQKGNPVVFTDGTTFYDGKTNGHQWSWTFGDGGTSSSQNPTHAYATENSYTVSLTATDNANQSCSIQQSLNVQKPIPTIIEVAP